MSRHGWRILVAFALLCGMIAAGLVATEEYRIRRIAAAADAVGQSPSPAERGRHARALADCADSDNERTLIPCIAGQYALARQAGPGEKQRVYLLRGARAEAKLLARVPDSGEALAASALLHSLTDDPGEQRRVMASLTESYRHAPFLRSSGLWRLWWGEHHGALATPAIRHAMLEEALWLGSLSAADRDAVLRALAGTPAYVSIALRLPGQVGEGMPLPR